MLDANITAKVIRKFCTFTKMDKMYMLIVHRPLTLGNLCKHEEIMTKTGWSNINNH